MANWQPYSSPYLIKTHKMYHISNEFHHTSYTCSSPNLTKSHISSNLRKSQDILPKLNVMWDNITGGCVLFENPHNIWQHIVMIYCLTYTHLVDLYSWWSEHMFLGRGSEASYHERNVE